MVNETRISENSERGLFKTDAVFDRILSCLVRIPFKCERHGVGYTVTPPNPILLKRRRLSD